MRRNRGKIPSSWRSVFLRALACLVIAAALAGCGYKLVREKTVELPGGVVDMAVPLAKNLSMEAALEDVYTQEMIRRFRADGRVEIVGPARADSLLRCTIESVQTRTVSYFRGRTQAEEVIVKSHCELAVADSGVEVWKSGSLRAMEEYPVGSDMLANESAKDTALLEACRETSETVRGLLLDRF